MKKTFPPFLYLISVAFFILTACANTSTPQPTKTIIPMPTLGIGSTMTGEDGATLVYVPEGEFSMGSDSGETNEQPVHTVYLDSYWIDQTEVTNKQYQACVDAGVCDPPSFIESNAHLIYYGIPEFDNNPVIYVNWDKANRYCEGWADGDLPTEAQWEKAARGTDARIYPWGNDAPNRDLLNYNSNIEDTTEVGSYKTGKSPYGVYDMAGNVLEWVNDWYGETYYQSSSSSNPIGPDAGQYRVLRGGAWYDNDNVLRSDYRLRVYPTITDFRIGFRCARSLPAPSTNTSTPQPTETIIPTPTPGISATLVYVPEGEFIMGNDASGDDEHTVYLDAFWIDQTEVTNKQYQACVDAGVCAPPSPIYSHTHSYYYGNPEFDNFPVIYVNWDQANRYCEVWADGDLPTEAQWEKVARGTDKRTYPWGEDISCDKANYDRSCVGDTTKVGSYESGKSPYGVYDMAGNVWEWANDWYGETYYQSSSPSNPLGPDTGEFRVLRGGSWYYDDYLARSAYRDWGDPTHRRNDKGFRCSRSP